MSRLISYALIAAILGGGVKLLSMEFKQLIPILRIIAGSLLIAMGLYMLDWWRGLQRLEKAGGLVWQYIQPYSSKLIGSQSWLSTLTLGLLWGFLPCGLVYSALGWAISHQADSNAALLMLGFGLGTLPSMFGASLASQAIRSVMHKNTARYAIAFSMMFFGLWTMAMPIMKMLKMH